METPWWSSLWDEMQYLADNSNVPIKEMTIVIRNKEGLIKDVYFDNDNWDCIAEQLYMEVHYNL